MDAENFISDLSEPHPLIPSNHLTVSFYIKYVSPPLLNKLCLYIMFLTIPRLIRMAVCDHSIA